MLVYIVIYYSFIIFIKLRVKLPNYLIFIKIPHMHLNVRSSTQIVLFFVITLKFVFQKYTIAITKLKFTRRCNFL